MDIDQSNLKPLRALGGHVVSTVGCDDLNVRFRESAVDIREVSLVRNASHVSILEKDWIASVSEVRITRTGFNIELGRKGGSGGARQPEVLVIESRKPSEISIIRFAAIAPPIVGGSRVDPDANTRAKGEALTYVTA